MDSKILKESEKRTTLEIHTNVSSSSGFLASSPQPWCWENVSIISGVLSLEGNSETVLSSLTPFSNCTNEEKRRVSYPSRAPQPERCRTSFQTQLSSLTGQTFRHRGLHLSERSVPSLLITSWGFLLPPRSTDLTDSEMPGELLSSVFHSASELPIWKPGWIVQSRAGCSAAGIIHART